MRKFLAIGLIVIAAVSCTSGDKTSGTMPEREYYKMLEDFKTGWNTWDTRSMFTQLYSPEGFAVKLALVDGKGEEADDLRAGNTRNDAAYVHPKDHVYDNSYTEVEATWHGVSVNLRCTSDGDRLIMLLNPLEGNSDTKGRIRVKAEYAWENTNSITGKDKLDLDGESGFHFITRDRHTEMTGIIVGSNMTFRDGCYYCDASKPVLIFTGEPVSIEDAEKMLSARKEAFDRECRKYGKNAELFRAVHSILGWDTIYDPADDIVVTPVSRNWNLRWSVTPGYGGYVLFDWDTFFASYMCSLFSRELAYSNASEVAFSVDKCGFVPKSRSDHGSLTADCSQPPVGSMAVWNIYERYKDKWFLEMLYPRLLTWNRWWPEARQTDGLLCWGSDPKRIRLGERWTGSTNNAILESGLDNSTMYDDVKINPETGQLDLQDVGLTSLYVMDCEYMSKIARELGHSRDAKELKERAAFFRNNIQRFWCEEDGMFYNIDTKTGEFNRHTSATNFYVLLADAATPEQAKRIVEEHLLNENEFWGEWVIPMTPRNEPGYQEQNYWRGRIWGPTNFLVYLGLRNYPDVNVRKSFIDKSVRLMLKGWNEKGYIYENWNAITGDGDDVSNCDYFYHWGALLGFMALLEENESSGGAQPADIIPAPVEYSVLPGSVRSDELTQLPEKVRISERAVCRRLEGRELADWQLKSAYWLEVGKKGIKIVAADEEGVFYARQSLKMMASLDSSVTCCTILDWPSYRHRGILLDESRHFQGKDFVKKQLEMMALLKMNRFHFHLVDNPGWRLQIDAYPRLTELTAWRPQAYFWDWEKDEIGGPFVEEGTPGAYGGYYTKQDIAEILAFAEERHIEVIPEIEMPGHNYETRAAYPELACSLPESDRPDHWELCPGKESTFEFLEKVLLEVFEMFPSEYVHIGGDEAGKRNWERCPDCQARMKAEGLENVEELQSYMIRRIERFAHEHGKRIIGWDEILEGGLAPDATVMSWRGTEGGLKAIAEGHDVIFTPTHYYYLDYHQDPNQYRAIGRYVPLEKVYSFDPMEEGISEADAHYVLGVQGNLWTEWVREAWHAEMMLYPRAFAIAETGWSPASRKDYPDFERRVSAFAAVARAMGYEVYGHGFSRFE